MLCGVVEKGKTVRGEDGSCSVVLCRRTGTMLRRTTRQCAMRVNECLAERLSTLVPPFMLAVRA